MKVIFYLSLIFFGTLSSGVSLFDSDPEELKAICTSDIEGKKRQPPLVTESECFDKFNCPVFSEMRKKHMLVLVDTTGGLTENEVGFLKNTVLSRRILTQEIEPYTKVTIVDLNDKVTTSNAKPIASICRPRSGSQGTPFGADIPHKSQGVNYTKSQFVKWGRAISLNTIEKLATQTEARESQIFEHINAVSTFPSFDFRGEDFEERTLVFFSDLLQNSERFNFPKHCKQAGSGACSDFNKFYKNTSNSRRNYLDKQKPSFSVNTKIIIYQIINKNVSSRLEKDLESFYKTYFQWAGIKEENIEHRLLYDS